MQLFAVSGFDVAGHPGTNADFPRAVVAERRRRWSWRSWTPGGCPRRPPPTRSPSRRRSTGGPVSTSATSCVLEVPGPGVLKAMILGEPVARRAEHAGPRDDRRHRPGLVLARRRADPVRLLAGPPDALTPPGTGYINAMLLLDAGTAAIPRVEADLEEIAGRPIEVIDWTRQLAQITTATRVEASALLAFAVVATIVDVRARRDRHRPVGGGVRGRGRDAAGDRVHPPPDHHRRRRPAAAAVVVGVGGAAVIVWLLSGRYPIGVGRQGEPSPGRHADLAILPAGVAVLVLVGVAAALVAAWRVGQPRPIGGVRLGHDRAASGRPTCRCP